MEKIWAACGLGDDDALRVVMLARLPLLHPEGLRDHTSDGPADPLRRIVKMRSSIVKRRTAVFQRLDAQLELLGPAWYDALGTRYGKATLALLARYADPQTVIRLGHARLTRFLIRHSRGAWREPQATLILAAAQESLQLWGAGADARIDFAELAADIAIEAEQAQALTDQIDDLDERAANLYAEADPTGIIASATCHIATMLLTRIASCWRTGQPYQLRNTDGRLIDADEGRRLVAAHHRVDRQTRINAANTRQSQRLKGRTGRGQQESPSAPIHRPVIPTLELVSAAQQRRSGVRA
uniref:hypothetical protein n=1 Tax=Mycolicibacterium sarraceniae TaxID=1534348 RepID=UPI001F354C71|nr:hypothetical protein [Mycolicibacterium sarraceniae]